MGCRHSSAHLHLPFSLPGFESQAHHLCFYQSIFELFHCGKDKNEQKEAGIGSEKKVVAWKAEIWLPKRESRSELHWLSILWSSSWLTWPMKTGSEQVLPLHQQRRWRLQWPDKQVWTGLSNIQKKHIVVWRSKFFLNILGNNLEVCWHSSIFTPGKNDIKWG